MKRCIFTLKHDRGRFRLATVARDLQAAIRIICAAENCPESAIIAIKKTTPKKRRTPRWPSRYSRMDLRGTTSTDP
ncbi:MAG TPA: hypothetical protein P5077_10585 [bacterium]|nr:hypothetical protein [bacterium]